MTLFPVKAASRTLALIVAVCAVQGCQQQASPTSPTSPSPVAPADWLQIVRISPSAGTAFEPGATVSIDLTAHYKLTTMDSGRIVLLLVDQLLYPLQNDGEEPIIVIGRGEGEVNFSKTLQMPARSITLYVALFPLDSKPPSSVYDEATFPMKRKGILEASARTPSVRK